MAETIVVASEI